MCNICSKLIKKTPEQSQGIRSGVFIINFHYILHSVDFEQVNAGWDN